MLILYVTFVQGLQTKDSPLPNYGTITAVF